MDAAVVRFGWGVLALGIAATIAVRLAAPTCELTTDPTGARMLAQLEATRAEIELARLQHEPDEMDRRVAEAMRVVEQSQLEPEHFDQVVEQLRDLDNELDSAYDGALEGSCANSSTSRPLSSLRVIRARVSEELDHLVRDTEGIPGRKRRIGSFLVLLDSEIEDLRVELTSGTRSDHAALEVELGHRRETREQLYRSFDDPDVEVHWFPGTKP